MTKKSRYKHIVNWNVISIVVTLGGIIIATILNYNQRQINILSAQVSVLERENANLKTKTDPSWEEKFNTQRQFFEGEITDREKKIKTTESNFTSLRKKGYLLDTNNVILPKQVVKRIIKDLIKGDRDSVLVGLYKQQISLYDQANLIYKETDSLNKKIINFQVQQLNNYKKIIELQNFPKSESGVDSFLIAILIILGLVGCISSLIVWYKFKKERNSE